MKSFIVRSFAGALVACAATGAAMAQQSNNQVAVSTAWSVFEEKSPRECWAVSAPTKTVNTRDGRNVEAKRGDILLMTFFRPGSGVNGQVAFTGGYPFAKGSTVDVVISGKKYEMFTEGEWAWPATAADDAKLITALKGGSEAKLSARSGRGTITNDTFSLAGYTAAVGEAQKRCK